MELRRQLRNFKRQILTDIIYLLHIRRELRYPATIDYHYGEIIPLRQPARQLHA